MKHRAAIFFDVDGVLVHGYHYNPFLRQPWDINIKDDLGIDRDLFNRQFFARYFDDVVVGKISLKEALDRSLPTLKFQGSSEEIISYWLRKDSNINKELFSIIDSLSAHDSVNLYIATNQEENRAEYLWENLNFKKYFKGIYYSAKIGLTKHNPDFFSYINQDLGLQPNFHTILYFDDTPEYLNSAQKVGWKGYKFTDFTDVLENEYVKNILG